MASRHCIQIPSRKKREGPIKNFPGSSTYEIPGLGHVTTCSCNQVWREVLSAFLTAALNQTREGREGASWTYWLSKAVFLKCKTQLCHLSMKNFSMLPYCPRGWSGSCAMSSDTWAPLVPPSGFSASSSTRWAAPWLRSQPMLSPVPESPLSAHICVMNSYFILLCIIRTFMPKFLREKWGCVLYMGSTNSISTFLILIFMLMC